jgi:hypothetical protein
VHPEAVSLARADVRQVAVHGLAGSFGQLDPGFLPRRVEQAHLHGLGDLGEDTDVGADPVEGAPERERVSREDSRHNCSRCLHATGCSRADGGR